MARNSALVDFAIKSCRIIRYKTWSSSLSTNRSLSSNTLARSDQLVALRDTISFKVNERVEYNRIYMDLVGPLRAAATANKSISSKSSLERVEHKLRFKLGWIIYSLQRLSDVFESNYLSRRALLDLITTTTLDNVNQHDIEHKKVELDVLNLNEISQQQEQGEELSKLQVVRRACSSVYCLDSSSSLTTSDSRDDRVAAVSGGQVVLTSMYLMASNPTLDYSEDIVASIDKEIQLKVDEMRPHVPLPLLMSCMSELRLCFVKQWVKMYERDL